MEINENIIAAAETDAAIAQAEAEFAQDGQFFDAEKALASLRRKHFGAAQC